MVAELNPEGGSLVARHDMAPEPGLTTLAAAGRRGLTPGTVGRHCRPIPGGPVALLGPISSDQATSALSVLGPHLAAALDQIPDTDVLADCGRISASSAALGVISTARRVVMVVTPTLEGVACAQFAAGGIGADARTGRPDHRRGPALSPGPGRCHAAVARPRVHRARRRWHPRPARRATVEAFAAPALSRPVGHEPGGLSGTDRPAGPLTHRRPALARPGDATGARHGEEYAAGDR